MITNNIHDLRILDEYLNSISIDEMIRLAEAEKVAKKLSGEYTEYRAPILMIMNNQICELQMKITMLENEIYRLRSKV
jgi:uncharacterized small protein (DUF1192 family)